MLRGGLWVMGGCLLVLTLLMMVLRTEAAHTPPFIAYADNRDIWTIRTDGTDVAQRITSDYSIEYELRWLNAEDLQYFKFEEQSYNLVQRIDAREKLVVSLAFDLRFFALAEDGQRLVVYQAGEDELRSFDVGERTWTSKTFKCECLVEYIRASSQANALSIATREDRLRPMLIYSETEITNRTPRQDFATSLSWSPDEQAMAYTTTSGELKILPVAGEPETIFSTIGEVASPVWSPDGEWIVFRLTRNYQGYLHRIRPDGSDMQRITHAAYPIAPTWSPDGQWLSYISRAANQNSEIRRMRADGSQNVALAAMDNPQPVLGVIAWSPPLDMPWQPFLCIAIASLFLAGGRVINAVVAAFQAGKIAR